jgi:hypothetical protein
MTRITGTLHEYQCGFMVISRWILLRMINISPLIVEKIKKLRNFCLITFSLNIVSFMKWSRSMWGSRTGHRCQYNTSHKLRLLGNFATNIHWEYVIHIAVLQQQWLHQRPSVLIFAYVACFVKKMSLNLRKSWSVGILCILCGNLIWPAGFDDLSAVTEYRDSRFLRNLGKFIPADSGRSPEYYILHKSQFEGC